MTDIPYREIAANGLWRQNAGMVQLLGLCPLLAVSSTLVNGASLGLATMIVMGLSNAGVAQVRTLIPHEVRIPVFIVIIAVLVTVIQLLMNAFLHPLYLVLGIFVPLIATNCVVLARVETFASKNSPAKALIDGLMMGLGLWLALTLLGGVREVIGSGTLLSGIDLTFGPAAKRFVIHLAPKTYAFALATMPPGAFICLGLLIAAKNTIDSRAAERRLATSIARVEPA